jgi:DnaJ-class molecular chaperone
MASEYYNILGVSRNASDDEIKRAYKKLALKTHPDKNGGDDSEFKKINIAYETLSNPEKKNDYDNPHMNIFDNANNNPFSHPFNHPFFNLHRNNSQHANMRMNDHHYICKISLKEVFFGTTKKLRVNRNRICKSCIKSCDKCNGSGKITQQIQMGPFTQILDRGCNTCNATGKIKNDGAIHCTKCLNGTINEERIFEIVLNPGIESGKIINFEEWGEQPSKDNQIPGSFIVTIKVEEDPIFKRKNLHLRYTVDLTFKESIIGKILSIPHFSGNIDIDTRGFGIINPEKEYIIYNKGLCDENKKNGDLYLIFKIKYPEKTFTDEQIEILKKISF